MNTVNFDHRSMEKVLMARKTSSITVLVLGFCVYYSDPVMTRDIASA